MEVDSVQIRIEHGENTTFLLMLGKPFGLKARITLEQLDSLAQELTREATTWRRRIIPDWYSILGVGPSATEAEIKAAYRRLMKEHHPDLAHGDEAHTKLLNEAYSVVGDQDKRHAYDQALNQQERSTAA